MPQTDPKTWIAPTWHKDWRNADSEFKALKKFSVEALEFCNDLSVEIEEIEEGYLKVNIFCKRIKLAELYTNINTTGLDYILYVPFEYPNEEEFHFSEISEGINILRLYV